MTFAASLGFLLLAMQSAPQGSALEQFFIGRTEGSGTVQMIMSGRHGVRDRSTGRRDRSGALIIDQVVEEEGKPARRRAWRLVRSGATGVTGTISDARGPVTGELSGNVLRIRYVLTEGPSVEHTITLQPGGRTAISRMTFRRFGLRVATVDVTSRKLD